MKKWGRSWTRVTRARSVVASLAIYIRVTLDDDNSLHHGMCICVFKILYIFYYLWYDVCMDR